MTKRQLTTWLLGSLAMVIVLTTLYTMVKTNTVVDLIRHDQATNIQRAKDTKSNTEQIKRLAAQIESCTNPTGECFKRGQRRTGEAVASINDVILAAAACDEGSTPLPEIRACVAELLKTD